MSLFIFLGISVPVFASSQSYSFTMNNRMVNGSKNGKFYYFNGGAVSISGSHSITARRYPNYNPLPVFFELKECGLIFDTSMGEVQGPPAGNVRGTLTNKTNKGKKYYLVIYTGENDYITRQGSGRLNN